MNTSHVVGFSGSAAKRSIAAMVSSGSLSCITLFLGHRLPGVQRRAALALGTPAPIVIQAAPAAKVPAEDYPKEFYLLYGTTGCYDVESTLAKVAADKAKLAAEVIPAESPLVENRVEASLPDFAKLAAEYGEPDPSALPGLYAAKGNDEAALRRSLGARRMSRAKAAKKAAAETN